MKNSKIPVCPLLSIGSDSPMVCIQEECAWYMANLKKCGAYLIAHNAMLEVKKKQAEK
ncbi:hypothetical protein IKA15_01595 [bacterium]|nr:hypothetical protein [bacterium]